MWLLVVLLHHGQIVCRRQLHRSDKNLLCQGQFDMKTVLVTVPLEQQMPSRKTLSRIIYRFISAQTFFCWHRIPFTYKCICNHLLYVRTNLNVEDTSTCYPHPITYPGRFESKKYVDERKKGEKWHERKSKWERIRERENAKASALFCHVPLSRSITLSWKPTV